MPKKKKIEKQSTQKVNPTKPVQVDLKANNQFCSVLHATFFNPKQCQAMIDQCVEELWMSGETIGGGVNKKVRNVEQQIMPIDRDWETEQN